MRSPTRMTKHNENKGIGKAITASLVQKLTKKGKEVSSEPNATRAQKKKMKEAKIRQLLQVNEGNYTNAYRD